MLFFFALLFLFYSSLELLTDFIYTLVLVLVGNSGIVLPEVTGGVEPNETWHHKTCKVHKGYSEDPDQ